MKNESDEQLCLNMDLMNCGSKLAGYRCFLLSRSFWDDWHTVVLTGTRTKPTKDTDYVLVENIHF